MERGEGPGVGWGVLGFGDEGNSRKVYKPRVKAKIRFSPASRGDPGGVPPQSPKSPSLSNPSNGVTIPPAPPFRSTTTDFTPIPSDGECPPLWRTTFPGASKDGWLRTPPLPLSPPSPLLPFAPSLVPFEQFVDTPESAAEGRRWQKGLTGVAGVSKGFVPEMFTRIAGEPSILNSNVWVAIRSLVRR